MKYIVTILALVLSMNAHAASNLKKICHDKKNKAGKIVKECKMVKVHKKLTGRAIPVK